MSGLKFGWMTDASTSNLNCSDIPLNTAQTVPAAATGSSRLKLPGFLSKRSIWYWLALAGVILLLIVALGVIIGLATKNATLQNEAQALSGNSGSTAGSSSSSSSSGSSGSSGSSSNCPSG